MGEWLKNLTNISILCSLFFLFFPLSEWISLAVFLTCYCILYYINQKRNIHVYIILTVLFILSSCMFYPDFLTIMCMCLSSFALQTIKIEPGRKLVAMILLVGIHLFINQSLHLWIILIALFSFNLISTIMITSRNKLQLYQRMKVMLAMGIGGSILIWIIPYLANGIRYIFSIVMYGVTSVVSRGFFEFKSPAETDEKKQERINKLTSSTSNQDKYQVTEYTTHPYLYSIFIISLLILFIIAIIYLVKRKKSMQLEIKGKSISLPMSPFLISSKSGRNEGNRVNQTPPANIPIRMLVYKFEKEMKGIYIREHGELFRDWLNRIHSNNSELNGQLSEIYEKSRYGEKDIPKNEVKVFKEMLKQIKNQLNT